MMEKTINEVFRNRVAKFRDRIAVEKKRDGKWEQATWNEYYDKSSSLGMALVEAGVKKGDRIALLSENRLEWLFTDMGTLGIGGVVVPIYTTLTAEEIGYIIENSESKVLIVENRDQLDKALTFEHKIKTLEKIVVIEPPDEEISGSKTISFDALLSQGKKSGEPSDQRFRKLSEAVMPEDIATIVYTSGTTGLPKGVMISHKNIMAVINSICKIEPTFVDENDQSVPFLPLSHVFERIAGHFYGMYAGITSSYANSLETFAADVKEKRPTVVLAVPRVCEKVYQKITMQVGEQPKWKQMIFHWGHKIGIQISELKEKKKTVPLLMAIKYKIAYVMIFKKLAEALGGRVRWMTASGAPTSRKIIQFFNAAGISVLEGYGMTECCAPATLSGLYDYRIGTVGKPLPDVDVKIAEDGEILIKGDNVFAGYWKMEQETKDAFTEDGYLMSGDIGAFEDGFLTITDRKKDLIITSGGKNIAPQKIEGLFLADPLFMNCVVIGERKNFLSALININLEHAKILAARHNIDFDAPEELLKDKDFLSIIEDHVAEKNAVLARYESIKKYTIIENEFSKESGELTATLKLKRSKVNKMYSASIEQMYQDSS
jgi:long-chain acyl-CoA synthetase